MSDIDYANHSEVKADTLNCASFKYFYPRNTCRRKTSPKLSTSNTKKICQRVSGPIAIRLTSNVTNFPMKLKQAISLHAQTRVGGWDNLRLQS